MYVTVLKMNAAARRKPSTLRCLPGLSPAFLSPALVRVKAALGPQRWRRTLYSEYVCCREIRSTMSGKTPAYSLRVAERIRRRFRGWAYVKLMRHGRARPLLHCSLGPCLPCRDARPGRRWANFRTKSLREPDQLGSGRLFTAQRASQGAVAGDTPGLNHTKPATGNC